MTIRMANTSLSEASIYSCGPPGICQPESAITPPDRRRGSPACWSIPTGVYTARELVRRFAPLLDTVVHHLGPDPPNTKPARIVLLDNVAANLSTDTRESSLPLYDLSDISRREVRDQARRIGQVLVQWAREYTDEPYDPDLYLRGPGDGHLLLQSSLALMYARCTRPHHMQLLSEYMRQMVVLRDALLPFQNFYAVPIPVDGRARGIRHLEAPRERFLTTVFAGHITQASVVSLARAVLAPDLPVTMTGGYGFQYTHGLILPAILAGGVVPYHLLRYVPSKMDSSAVEVLFDYHFPDYHEAPRGDIPAGPPTILTRYPIDLPNQKEELQTAGIGLQAGSSTSAIRGLELRLEFKSGDTARVDVGQIARGLRHSYEAREETRDSTTNHTVFLHSASEILIQPGWGLSTAETAGFHVIPVDDPTIALALLGKLYPRNVILLPNDEQLGQTDDVGEDSEAKFVIWGGFKRGGLKGVF
ncbi:hypothetical protein G4B11_010125 [Aspergillus flavus]|nr:hypothetical protein G4B11_010125 [Aspergillus flavus]